MVESKVEVSNMVELSDMAELSDLAELSDAVGDAIEKGENKFVIGDIDYAILKLVSYRAWVLAEIANILQIRTLTIEKHIYTLSKEGFVAFQLQNFAITKNGEGIIRNFERDSSIDKWKPIENFIVSSMDNRRSQKLKMYKILDFVLLLLMIVLIMSIIYVGLR